MKRLQILRRRGQAATAVGVFRETYVVAPDRMETSTTP
jgi:hypothetical protein